MKLCTVTVLSAWRWVLWGSAAVMGVIRCVIILIPDIVRARAIRCESIQHHSTLS